MWKEGLVAGIAVLGGFMVLKQTTSKSAESVQFSAPRGFPKKLRIESGIKFKKTPLNQIFFPNAGYYFAQKPSYDSDDGRLSYHFYDKEDWMILNRFTSSSDYRLDKQIYRKSPESDNYQIFYGFFQYKGMTDNDISFLEFMPSGSQSELAWFNSNYTFSPISQADFNLAWETDVDSAQNHLDRRDAYWELYTNGKIDSDMDDENGSIYRRIEGFMRDVIEKGLTPKVKTQTEEQEFNLHIESVAQDFLNGIQINGPFQARLKLEEDLYKPTLDQAKIIAEFFVLRSNLLLYEEFENGIAPLIAKGWNPSEGAIVQNIRTTWDAYRDSSDVPDRKDRAYYQIVGSKEEMEKVLWSESFVIKRILKRRAVFTRAIQEDIKLTNDAAEKASDKAGQESATKVRDGLSATPPFSNFNYYQRIVESDYWFDSFIEEINEAVKEAGSKLTEAEKKQIKPKIIECYDAIEAKDNALSKQAYDEALQENADKKQKGIDEMDRHLEV